MYSYVIVVSWFLQCMEFVLRVLYVHLYFPEAVHTNEGGAIPHTVKTMRPLTCSDRPYKANHQINFGARMSILYCTPYGIKYRTL